jgi:DNA-directed RNA polymerase subunit RPC12/RpoP
VTARLIVCPECGRRVRSRRVVYGLPTIETMERAERGEVILGGCDPSFGSGFVCSECGASIERDHQRDDRPGSAGPLRGVPKG